MPEGPFASSMRALGLPSSDGDANGLLRCGARLMARTTTVNGLRLLGGKGHLLLATFRGLRSPGRPEIGQPGCEAVDRLERGIATSADLDRLKTNPPESPEGPPPEGRDGGVDRVPLADGREAERLLFIDVDHAGSPRDG